MAKALQFGRDSAAQTLVAVFCLFDRIGRVENRVEPRLGLLRTLTLFLIIRMFRTVQTVRCCDAFLRRIREQCLQFAFVVVSQVAQFVGQIQGGEDRDLRQIVRRRMTGEQAHPLIDESGNAFDVLDFAVRAQVVGLIEDVHFNRLERRLWRLATHKIQLYLTTPTSGLDALA